MGTRLVVEFINVEKFCRRMFQNWLFPLENLIGRIWTPVSYQLATIIFWIIQATDIVGRYFFMVYSGAFSSNNFHPAEVAPQCNFWRKMFIDQLLFFSLFGFLRPMS